MREREFIRLEIPSHPSELLMYAEQQARIRKQGMQAGRYAAEGSLSGALLNNKPSFRVCNPLSPIMTFPGMLSCCISHKATGGCLKQGQDKMQGTDVCFSDNCLLGRCLMRS